MEFEHNSEECVLELLYVAYFVQSYLVNFMFSSLDDYWAVSW